MNTEINIEFYFKGYKHILHCMKACTMYIYTEDILLIFFINVRYIYLYETESSSLS